MFLKFIFQMLFISIFTVINTCNAYASEFHNLSFMGGYRENHSVTEDFYEPFFRKIKTDLQNKITFKYFTVDSLYPEENSYKVIENGKVDFAAFSPVVGSEKTYLASIITIPSMVSNSVTATLLFADIKEKYSEILKQYPNSHYLCSWASAPYHLHSIKPIRTIADMRGKKLIMWNNHLLDEIRALGAVPIKVAKTDAYTALSTGMADGIIAPIATIRSYNFSETLKYQLLLNLNISPLSLVVNKELWETFSPEMQNYIKNKFNSDFALEIAKHLEQNSTKEIALMRARGHQVFRLSPEDIQKMNTLSSYAREVWLKEAKNSGTLHTA